MLDSARAAEVAERSASARPSPGDRSASAPPSPGEIEVMEEEDITPVSPASDQTPPQSPNQGFSHDMLGACHFCGSEEVLDTNCVH